MICFADFAKTGQELNVCLTDRYVLAYVEVEFCEFGKSFGAALANRDPESAERTPAFIFQF